MESNINKSRRNFFKQGGSLVGLGLCSCVVGSILTSCEKDEGVNAEAPKFDYSTVTQVKVSDFPSIAAVGSIAAITVTSKKDSSSKSLIVYRLSEEKFVAMSSSCPHAGADIIIKDNALYCALHNAEFKKTSGEKNTDGSAGTSVANLITYSSKYVKTLDAVNNIPADTLLLVI